MSFEKQSLHRSQKSPHALIENKRRIQRQRRPLRHHLPPSPAFLLFCSVLFLLRIRSRPKRRILRQFVTTAQHMIQPAAAAAAAASISQSRLDFGARARQVVQRRMRNVEEPTDRLSVQMSRCECQCNLGPRDNIWRHCSIEPLHWKFE